MSDRQDHWERVYATKASDRVSWFQATAAPSLELIEAAGAEPAWRMVDVGGGASPLAGELLARGWRAVTVLDIATSALDVARRGLGAAADQVDWVVSDVLDWRPEARFDLWHDRAVFHFLTEPEQRRRYREVLEAALIPGGWLVLGAFGPDGPERCSDLPVQRWSPEALARELGPGFSLRQSFDQTHQTPWGSAQIFSWSLFERAGAVA
jgi:SAM-dependent methyltransferase